MHYDLLHDHFWRTCLINVRVEPGILKAGIAYFQSGTPQEIDLISTHSNLVVCRIALPKEALNTQTHLILTHPDDEIELVIVNNH